MVLIYFAPSTRKAVEPKLFSNYFYEKSEKSNISGNNQNEEDLNSEASINERPELMNTNEYQHQEL